MWRTAEVKTAEDVLAKSVAAADQAMRDAAKLRYPAREPSAEDVRRVMRFAKSNEASPELQALQRRIAAGYLSWRQVLLGEAAGDRGVRAAFEKDRDRLAALCRGEEPRITPPKPQRRDDDEPMSFTEDAW
ncbi:hypothetical protein ABZ816_11770 [Actinosynnema sp. NPDC047251]|uniref:Uncharacterized protein n=1 Tax=Saccharothrix espanaensis (strain ATCC 51144 / DSM 44229 / JCM 9112 / NBRC 15066 / NRRL 15764) TaxID=1179773 RepID=K0KES8_SACES|nr:hypothetical protein [Saccharothrix espanaensis]CCH35274.1 hypothetical protein BN6_80560 [Saccharothrix espanaensis DSM 44229]